MTTSDAAKAHHDQLFGERNSTLAAFFVKSTTLTGGPAPVRAYIEQLLPAVLDGSVNPGKVFDRTVSIEDTPQAYAAMDARRALKVMIKP